MSLRDLVFAALERPAPSTASKPQAEAETPSESGHAGELRAAILRNVKAHGEPKSLTDAANLGAAAAYVAGKMAMDRIDRVADRVGVLEREGARP